MESVNPFPIIHKAQYDFKFGPELKGKCLEYLGFANDKIRKEKLDTLEKDGGITTVPVSNICPPHSWDEFEDFKLWLFKQVDEVWEHWKLNPAAQRYLSESWINLHPPGAYTAEHHHQNVTVAVAAYLEVPENSGRLLIKNPLQIYKMGEPLNYYYYDQKMDWMPIDVKTNDVLFFPGWLTHATERNLSLDDRYIMSLNIMGNFVNDQSHRY